MKKLAILVFVLFLLLLFASNGEARSASSQELIENAAAHDGKFIEYQGEVVGDIMIRGDFAWININDGKNAIGVWCKASDAKKISRAGRYRTMGDIVNVRGFFHRACSEHGGELDIHAKSLTVITPGQKINVPLNQNKFRAAIIMLIITLGTFGIYFRRLKKFKA